jgi:hypothetical protein|tara:strand:- start:556 stop:837 length:282 start_codon:yes stop_codon:yes gene_type:complete
MITTSLIRELEFISKNTRSPVCARLRIGKIPELIVKVDKGILELEYKGNNIWTEGLSDAENFGVESCDTIYQIIEAIDKDQDWTRFPHDFVSS